MAASLGASVVRTPRPARVPPRAGRRRARLDAVRVRRPRRARRAAARASADEPPADAFGWDDLARRALATELVRTMLRPGGRLEPRLERLPLPERPVPRSLLALARASSPAAALRDALHPRVVPFPDCDGAARAGCELAPGARADGARRVRCRDARRFLARLFLLAERHTPHELNRWDLFHGHLFVARELDDDDGGGGGGGGGVVGVLMHAKEYPAFDDAAFPIDLGFCQRSSPVKHVDAIAARRNLLFVADASTGWAAFATVDCAAESESESESEGVAPGVSNPLHPGLLAVPELYTTYEGDFGDVAGEVVYVHGLRDRRPEHAVFAFPRR